VWNQIHVAVEGERIREWLNRMHPLPLRGSMPKRSPLDREQEMGTEVTIGPFHKKLVKDVFQEHLSDEDAMLLFWLLHSCEITVVPGVLHETSHAVAEATTQREAAEVVASIYGFAKDGDYRADRYHWYNVWNGDWGSYGHGENLSEAETIRLDCLKRRLESHRWVCGIREED